MDGSCQGFEVASFELAGHETWFLSHKRKGLLRSRTVLLQQRDPQVSPFAGTVDIDGGTRGRMACWVCAVTVSVARRAARIRTLVFIVDFGLDTTGWAGGTAGHT